MGKWKFQGPNRGFSGSGAGGDREIRRFGIQLQAGLLTISRLFFLYLVGNRMHQASEQTGLRNFDREKWVVQDGGAGISPSGSQPLACSYQELTGVTLYIRFPSEDFG